MLILLKEQELHLENYMENRGLGQLYREEIVMPPRWRQVIMRKSLTVIMARGNEGLQGTLRVGGQMI